ncbi:hypothetical protein HBI56_104700 [Parastagonospora nodorum]|uniref:NACHT domain-containing protein n=1 Tax=Phaeosphaeria nodorum (strain SN15 / ATCC MYA-4574 / FGSC 10173) TaxID=321614 RepID=A0A7U2I7Q3_PHANO|nr:hypothetical protein HBH56_134210 [Parastagonospora nodorum]QRD02688.1 hypothetical protein JI435_114260 [Parastagonospora nodorum SN15]KAH3927085.1 hypothetical protein HBH54_159080 [Parastagonospora nodorum]KAH3949543.1 hypothetical protein HBH53_089270 [Parastagonospora nodorum]KAH3974846.1 hypothetical protein HBH52_132470 [Parastagonospora nodorum]
MAEGLAAIGLAGNIIQFITFGSALVSKSREIHRSASGLSIELVDLNVVARDIKYFSSRISADTRVSDRLYDIAKASSNVAHELVEAVADIQKNGQASISGPTKWKSFRKALKCIWKKEMIDELKSRLELLRNQLSLHLISDTNDYQIHLSKLVQEWRKQNERSGYQITNQIQALDTQLSIIKQHSAGLSFDHEYWKKLHDMLFKVSYEVRQVSHGHTILQSLRYECMETRMEAIKEAHQRTFDWIFDINMGQLAGLHRTIPFTEWLQSGSGIYWVTGKPGCGKSTLMKYLYSQAKTDKHLNAWAGNATLVRASFYFWNPGEEMQKSLEGLLQTLLYHILRTCPELIPALCPERWNEQHVDMKSVRPWTLGELQKTIAAFQALPPVAAKFYFHIDGLDEYFGDSWDVIDTMQNFVGCPNIKLCLSSRPWNSFQDAFGRSNPCMLRLHEYTRKDIETFAHDNLMSYTTHSDFEPRLFNDMIQDIVERAQGVFLWVRLVVRSLRDGIINDDPVSTLHERLRTIPVDLEPFFEHILGSVQGFYRTTMAATFLAALRTNRPLSMMQYHFLEKNNSASYFKYPSRLWNDTKVERAVLQTERQLNGRFKGLLEPSSSRAIQRRTTVDFLHRTLRDFLKSPRMADLLQSWAPRDLNVPMAISRALIATCMSIDLHPSMDNVKTAIEFAAHAAQETRDTTHSFAIIDQAEALHWNARPNESHIHCRIHCYIVRFAMSVGHTEYLRYRFRQDGAILDLNMILKHAIVCPLEAHETFDPCLPPVSDSHDQDEANTPHPEMAFRSPPVLSMVQSLLDFGADPNAEVEGASSWTAFLDLSIQLMDRPGIEQCWGVFGAFFQQPIRLNHNKFHWAKLFKREQAMSKDGLANRLKYLQRLFTFGLNPNMSTHNTTFFVLFLRTLVTNYLDFLPFAQKLQDNILREFLLSGADITKIYRDHSTHGWLDHFLREMVQYTADGTILPRIEQYGLLLEHGLQPNAVVRNNITVWDRILKAMHQGLQEGRSSKPYHQAVQRLLVMSLDKGAAPDALGLPRILHSVAGETSLLSLDEIQELERAMRPSDRGVVSPSPVHSMGSGWKRKNGDEDGSEGGLRGKQGKRRGVQR